MTVVQTEFPSVVCMRPHLKNILKVCAIYSETLIMKFNGTLYFVRRMQGSARQDNLVLMFADEPSGLASLRLLPVKSMSCIACGHCWTRHSEQILAPEHHLDAQLNMLVFEMMVLRGATGIPG